MVDYFNLHHYAWDYVQMIELPFVTIFFIYRFFFGIWNIDNYYVPETLPSHSEIINFWDNRCKIDKNVEEKRKLMFKNKLTIELGFIDTFHYWYAYSGIIYYYYDIAFKLFYIGISFDICYWAYVLHHASTIFASKFHGGIYYYTWYLMFPSMYHSYMLTFPNFYWNYHIYGVSLAFFFFSQIYFKSLRTTLNSKYLMFSTLLIVPNLLLMAKYSCTTYI